MSEITPQAKDSIVYASSFAESCALETYLDSFPHASPTLFQTSIHPSAVQQALIGRQQSIGEFLPMTGRLHLVGQALHAAMISPCERVIVCGGEERGTWLLDNGIASERSFAFAFALTNEVEHAVARLRLSPAQNDESQSILLSEFFDRLVRREPINQSLCMGLHLQIQWI
uniref:hypothetical protein n=1 Tax=Rheinheimera sp. TaxID=1869214 RepID=UPI0040482E50